MLLFHIGRLGLLSAGETMERLNNSMKLTDINVDDYLAFYIPGGHGE